MILYVIRHAWAEQYGDPAWPDDSRRPLTDAGKKRFAKMIEMLVQRDFAPQLIATSPLVRCRQTAEIAAEVVPGSPVVIARDELAPGSDLAGLVAWTNRKAANSSEVAWVGHAPDVGHLTAALIGSPDSQVRFAKAAVAAVRFDAPLVPGEGELRWLVTAKLLGC